MNIESINIWRSPETHFGVHVENPNDLQDETILAEKVYTDVILSGIAKQGFNAIWLHGQLHHIIKNKRFPEFAPNEHIHLKALRNLIVRATKYGIKVMIYMQPPRSVSVSDTGFWKSHADLGGQVINSMGDDGKMFLTKSLCTSHPAVLAYIHESFADLTRVLPELGGYIIISASEYPAHCYSCRNCRPGPSRLRKLVMDQVPTDCPSCAQSEPEDIVVDLLKTIYDGVRSVSQKHALVFWDWSWSMYIDPPYESIIGRLPQDCILMSDFERGGIRKRDGTFINEYSLGYPGPSKQFEDNLYLAGKSGIHVIAKLQIGTTHELASVCSLPLILNLFRKADFIRKNKLSGFMGCWNFGNFDSANISAFHFFLNLTGVVSEKKALTDFAHTYFPNCSAPKLIRAWELFSEAMEYYPFSVPFLYDGPVNHSLALIPEPGPLSGGVVGRSWLPDKRGDDYSNSITKEFPLDKIIDCLHKISLKWGEGLQEFHRGIASVKTHEASIELGNAAICSAIWKSSYLMFKIYRLRVNWEKSKRPEYDELTTAELENLEEILPYVEQDKRQGFHIEGRFYSFSAELICKKIQALKRNI